MNQFFADSLSFPPANASQALLKLSERRNKSASKSKIHPQQVLQVLFMCQKQQSFMTSTAIKRGLLQKINLAPTTLAHKMRRMIGRHVKRSAHLARSLNTARRLKFIV